MKNGKDFRKIQGGQYGAINFNNMIPVPDCALVEMDINSEPNEKYRRLLQNQYRAIKEDATGIINTATKLRTLVMTDNQFLSSYDRSVKERCCNLKMLETVYTQYRA